MRNINLVVVFVSLAIFSNSVLAKQYDEHYVFTYEEDQIYDVKFTNDTITWEGLSGQDKGRRETDHINRKKISDDIEVMQWTENDGMFVTLVFDRHNLNVVSSGKFGADMWLLSGKAKNE